MACVDTSTDNPLDAELNDKVYELASSISTFQNSKFSVLHAWLMQDESLLSTRLKPKVLAQYEKKDREYKQRLLDKFLRQHDSSRAAENVHVFKGKTSEVVSNFVRDNSVDLVVMGTIARSGLTGLLMGNASEEVLDQINCSVLAVKPYSFKTPNTHDFGQHDSTIVRTRKRYESTTCLGWFGSGHERWTLLESTQFRREAQTRPPHRFDASGTDHSRQHSESGMGGTGKSIR